MAAAVSFSVQAADGYPIRGFHWRHGSEGQGRLPVVVINAANSVRCRYYFRFAGFLFDNGFDAIAYDYRGIGESRPERLRGFRAGWLDWGRLDFDAVLRYAIRECPGRPIQVVAHSIGGYLIGLAESSHRIERIFTVGAQYAYWPDYAPASRLRMVARWHIAMPLITALWGYCPAKRLGWMEDTPRGVVRDWAFSRKHQKDLGPLAATVSAPILAVSTTDDEFGTVRAVERLLAYFSRSERTHVRVSPESIGETAIGHFAFFHSRFEQTLWRIPLAWLSSGEISTNRGRPWETICSKR
jgi:predicted alpha/beta hydrolase